MDDFEKYLKQKMQDEEFKKEYDNLEVEYDIIKSLVDIRKNLHLTQKDLSKITGINQADISRIETGNANPTIAMLKRLADGVGMKLKLEFIPKQ